MRTWRAVARTRASVAILLAVCFAGGSAWGLRAVPELEAQEQSRCQAQTDKVARPAEINLGETVRVTLTLTSGCPQEVSPVDVMLVLDISASMLDDNKIANAKRAAKAFIDAMDLGQSRVGLVAFNQDAGLHSGLTPNGAAVKVRIDALSPTGQTNISAAIDLAAQHLREQTRGVQQAMIVLTDGVNTVAGADPVPTAAGRAKADGVIVVTVCAGGQCDPGLEPAASAPDLYFNVPKTDELEQLYTRLAGSLQANAIVQWTVVDLVPANMRYLAGTDRPAVASAEALPDGSTRLTWRLAGDFPPAGLSYDLEPLATGLHPTNISAQADFKDRKGLPGTVPFPIPKVLVRGPCPPQPMEIFFLIDDSNCLAGATLSGMDSRAAIRKGVEEAMQRFRLRPGSGDTAAVIGYGDTSEIFQTLTDDPEAVLAGVDRITMRDNAANLDLAYRDVSRELRSVRHRPGTLAMTINITDGPMMQAPEQAKAVADALRRQGARHYNIAVGTIAQYALLRQISEPDGFWTLPFGGDVLTPYNSFGQKVWDFGHPAVCPPGGTPTPTATRVPGSPTPRPTVDPGAADWNFLPLLHLPDR